MAAHYQIYYCYLHDGSPVVLEVKPCNFSELPCAYITHCPNLHVAKKDYEAHLRIKRWQEVA